MEPHQAQTVTYFQSLAARLATKLPKKTQPLFLSLVLGILLAIARRRTVTTWLQAAMMSDDFRQAFYHMDHVGHNSQKLFDGILDEILQKLAPVIKAFARK